MARKKKEAPPSRRDQKRLGEIVAQRVRDLRRERRLTREQLASLCSPPLSSSAVAQLESGRPPRLTTLESLARALRVRAADLLDGEAPPPGPVREGAKGAKVLRRLIARLAKHEDDEHYLLWVEGIIAAFERGHASRSR